MLTNSAPVASPFSPATTNTAQAAAVEARARAGFREQLQSANRADAHLADLAATNRAAREASMELPSATAGLSTFAVAGAMSSVPAALDMLRSIALQSAAGELTDADRQTLHAAYAQLTAHVASTVGSAGAGAQAQTSAHDDEREDNAENTWRESSDDHRTTLTQTREEPRETVQMLPVDRSVTTQAQTLVATGHGEQKDPRTDFRTHELHVGADSYEPVSMRQSFSHPVEPASFGRLETHAETRHTLVAQAAHITQFVQVAQTEHIPPVVAVA